MCNRSTRSIRSWPASLICALFNGSTSTQLFSPKCSLGWRYADEPCRRDRTSGMTNSCSTFAPRHARKLTSLRWPWSHTRTSTGAARRHDQSRPGAAPEPPTPDAPPRPPPAPRSDRRDRLDTTAAYDQPCDPQSDVAASLPAHPAGSPPASPSPPAAFAYRASAARASTLRASRSRARRSRRHAHHDSAATTSSPNPHHPEPATPQLRAQLHDHIKLRRDRRIPLGHHPLKLLNPTKETHSNSMTQLALRVVDACGVTAQRRLMAHAASSFNNQPFGS